MPSCVGLILFFFSPHIIYVLWIGTESLSYLFILFQTGFEDGACSGGRVYVYHYII